MLPRSVGFVAMFRVPRAAEEQRKWLVREAKVAELRHSLVEARFVQREGFALFSDDREFLFEGLLQGVLKASRMRNSQLFCSAEASQLQTLDEN